MAIGHRTGKEKAREEIVTQIRAIEYPNGPGPITIGDTTYIMSYHGLNYKKTNKYEEEPGSDY